MNCAYLPLKINNRKFNQKRPNLCQYNHQYNSPTNKKTHLKINKGNKTKEIKIKNLNLCFNKNKENNEKIKI
jgi:hypothetical protein